MLFSFDLLLYIGVPHCTLWCFGHLVHCIPAEFSAHGTDAVLRPKGKLNENSGRSFVLLFSLGHHRLL